MATKPISQVVREILSAHPSLPGDEVIARAKARGLKASAESIRYAFYDARKARKRAAAGTPTTAPVKAPPAKHTPSPAAPKPVSTPAKPKPASAGPSPTPNLSAVFATVELVTKAVDACGGVAHARQAAEAVRTCGGVDAFLKHVELVEGIRKKG